MVAGSCSCQPYWSLIHLGVHVGFGPSSILQGELGGVPSLQVIAGFHTHPPLEYHISFPQLRTASHHSAHRVRSVVRSARSGRLLSSQVNDGSTVQDCQKGCAFNKQITMNDAVSLFLPEPTRAYFLVLEFFDVLFLYHPIKSHLESVWIWF